MRIALHNQAFEPGANSNIMLANLATQEEIQELTRKVEEKLDIIADEACAFPEGEADDLLNNIYYEND